MLRKRILQRNDDILRRDTGQNRDGSPNNHTNRKIYGWSPDIVKEHVA